MLTFGRFGPVTLYHNTLLPSHVIRLPGGPHFDGGYDVLAKMMLREAGVSAGVRSESRERERAPITIS